MNKKPKAISPEIQQLLKAVYDDCDKEDDAVRQRQLREWRRLKLLWEGFNRVWYSEIAHDWRIWDETADEQTDQGYYDKPVNVFKGFLETIIAALSIVVPPVKCFPDNADDTLDLATAKAGDKIGQIIFRHNDAPMLWLHALFINMTEGMVAGLTKPDWNEFYGTYKKDKTVPEEQSHIVTTCPKCGHELDRTNSLSTNMGQTNPTDVGNPTPNPTANTGEQSKTPVEELNNQERDEFMPDNEDAEVQSELQMGQDICPACLAQMDPNITTEKFIVDKWVGSTTEPKARVCIAAYGGLNIKIPNYCKNQKQLPYLIFSEEIDYSMAIEEYASDDNKLSSKEFKAKLKKGGNFGGSDANYAQWARLSPEYQGEYPTNVVTIHKAYIRPGKFNILEDEDSVKKLRKQFPNGVCMTLVNDEFACAENAQLDDYWTLTENPLADFLHFQPVGEGLVSIQDITNDLISLVLQTIEHGIGQTFADTAVLNFKSYAQTETTPGGIFPATPKTGKGLSDSFHEISTATLSPEVIPFSNNVQSLGQFVSGALPSLFGGSLAGSDTASEYSMSRSQAQQRLQNTWKLFTIWWKNINSKAIPLYIKNVQEDERDVVRDNAGNFINILIRKAELEGKIGKVELEAHEAIPLTWMQRKDVIEKMLLSPNPEVMKIIGAPENLPLLHESLGLVDFYVPGEDDVIKQWDEIKLLLESAPLQEPPNPMAIQSAMIMGQPPPPPTNLPSVDIDVVYDKHDIHFEVVRGWAVSEAGRQAKTDNADGYQNVLLHGQAHFQQMQQAIAQQTMQQGPQLPPKGINQPPKPGIDRKAPITGESNVATNA